MSGFNHKDICIDALNPIQQLCVWYCTDQNVITFFLSGFGAFLRSEI